MRILEEEYLQIFKILLIHLIQIYPITKQFKEEVHFV
jgi:hypothetical protein